MKSERICYFLRYLIIVLFVNQVSTKKVPSALENFEEAIGRSAKCANKLLADIANKASAHEVKQDLTNYEKSLESVWDTFLKLWLTDEVLESYKAVENFVQQIENQRIELIKNLKNSDASYVKTLAVNIDEAGKTLDRIATQTSDFSYSPKIKEQIEEFSKTLRKSVGELHDSIHDAALRTYKEIFEQNNQKDVKTSL